MTHHHFKAPWGRTLLIISILTTLVMLGAAIILSLGQHQPWLIRRLWWNTVLPFDDIRSVQAEPLALSSSFRTCGNGGLYSFTGFYWSKQLGHFRAYVTDLNRTVIVRMKTRTAVLSPEDPEAFARTVESYLHT